MGPIIQQWIPVVDIRFFYTENVLRMHSDNNFKGLGLSIEISKILIFISMLK